MYGRNEAVAVIESEELLFPDMGTVEHPASVAFSRGQLIEQILDLNPSAPREFLDRFTDNRLEDYLAHLVSAQEPRGRTARWLRRGDSPAIVVKVRMA